MLNDESRLELPREWDAIHRENDSLRLVMLPELDGRIHIGLDKTHGYNFFYRNNVIKPPFGLEDCSAFATSLDLTESGLS